MANITDIALREHLEGMRGSLANLRKPVETGTAEVARYCQRWLSPWIANLGGDTSMTNVGGVQQKTGKANNRLYNSKAVRAHRTLMNGMSSGMSSPSQPWFKLALTDKDLAQHHEVRVWLDDVTALIYAFLAQTNIYNAMNFGYGELGWAGTECLLFTPHWRYGAVAHALRIDTVIRHVPMTVRQVHSQFGHDAMSKTARKLYDDGKYNSIIDVMHAIEPNLEREYGKIDRTNKPFRSIYWEAASDKSDGILAFEGFNRKIMATPRWNAVGQDIYSWGPGFEALPDARKLQLQELRFQQAQDYGVTPALQVPLGDMSRGANLVPRGITYTTSADMSRAGPLWTVDPNMVRFIGSDIMERTEPAVGEGFFEHLFMAITNMRGIQPRNVEEIARRHEEQLSQLGPVVDRVQVEKLQVIVLQAFEILSNAGRLPPAPRAMQGAEVSLEFTSILAQAQKMIGLGAMERALGFIGNIAGIKPEITDKLDADEAVDEYTNRLGVPARIIRSDQDVAAQRQARAQAAQQEKMAAMAPALQQAAAGAELLSRTDVNAGALGRLLPQPGV
jgi:hypothetical protein